MMKNILLLCLLAHVSLVLSDTPYKTCDSPLGTVSNVDIPGCTASPCILKKGSNITINVEFTTNADVAKATEDVKGIISGVPVPFPTPHPDACTTHGLTCPLKGGQKNNYVSIVPVSKIYPSLRLVVQWAVKDDSGKFMLCAQIPVQIK